jgi:hypothetical protein
MVDLYQTDSAVSEITPSQFKPERLIDDYESLVWTDRYDDLCNFELVVPWRVDLSTELRHFKYLIQAESDRVMMIETASLERDSEGVSSSLVKLTGRSVEKILKDRNTNKNGERDPEVVTGTPGEIVDYFIESYLMYDPETVNNIPELFTAAPPTGTSSTQTIPRGELFDIVQALCKAAGLGFKMARTNQPSELMWKTYRGTDRTVVPDYKLFSLSDESLINLSELESIADYKNHARVLGAKTYKDSYFYLSNSSGSWDRRTMIVDASNIGTDETTTVIEDQAALEFIGQQELSKQQNQYIRLVDGETPQDTDYNTLGLGDLVWIQGSTYGNKRKARISEFIWTSDATGEKRLPTFEVIP